MYRNFHKLISRSAFIILGVPINWGARLRQYFGGAHDCCQCLRTYVSYHPPHEMWVGHWRGCFQVLGTWFCQVPDCSAAAYRAGWGPAASTLWKNFFPPDGRPGSLSRDAGFLPPLSKRTPQSNWHKGWKKPTRSKGGPPPATDFSLQGRKIQECPRATRAPPGLT